MNVYIFIDGKRYFASSPEKFVEQLRYQSHNPSDDNQEYMMGFAKRAHALLGIDVSITDEGEFVQDLKDYHLLTVGMAN